MPVGSVQLELRLSALVTRLIGGSNIESRTELGAAGNFRFADGTGALQCQAIADASIPCNNVATAFSTFLRSDGNAFGSLTKLKFVALYNPPTNAAVILASSVSGLPVGTLDPGGLILWATPQATGLTVSGASTFTCNGGGGSQFVRAILGLNA